MNATNQAINSSPFEGSGSGDPRLNQGERKDAVADEANDRFDERLESGELSGDELEYWLRMTARRDD
jgi:hypothetical protein